MTENVSEEHHQNQAVTLDSAQSLQQVNSCNATVALTAPHTTKELHSAET